MKKAIKVLFTFYMVQFLCTACDPCVCPTSNTFERTYTDLSIEAWNTVGLQSQEVEDSVSIEAFGLTLLVNVELQEVAYDHLQQGSFGYTSAFACDCIGDEFITIDPFESIQINVEDTLSEDKFDVSDNFSIYGYDGELITIAEFFENLTEEHDDFYIELTSSENIPVNSNFSIDIYLESGEKISSETGPIHFYGF